MDEDTSSTDAPSAPAEPSQPTPAPEPETKEPEGKAEAPTEAPDTSISETPAEGEQPATDTNDQPAEEAPADEDPKEAARKGYADRQRMKAEAQASLRANLQPQTADELQALGYDARDAEVEALRQRVEIGEYANSVADLTANMSMDASQVEQELDIFNEKSPNFDKDYAEKVSREYIRDAQVQFDQSGQYILNARIPMYDYYKSRYDDRMAGMKRGQVSGQKAAEKMLAAADTPSSAAPPPPSDKDPIQAGFDEVFNS